MANPLESFELGRIMQWPEFSYDPDQFTSGGNPEEISELDPREPISDKDLGELIRGIPNTQVALAIDFLGRHQEGLLTHSEGLTGKQFYDGFSHMLGLSEEETLQTLGSLSNFLEFVRTAAKGNIITMSDSGRGKVARYSLNQKYRLVAPELAEIGLAHTLTHEVPFDVFFVKEKTEKIANTDLPLRWQIIRYIHKSSKNGEEHVDAAIIAKDLGTETYIIRKNIQALGGLGVEYFTRSQKQHRTIFTVENSLDTLPPKQRFVSQNADQTRQDVFNILQDLKRENVYGKYTIHDIYNRLLVYNREKYHREGTRLYIFLYLILRRWVEELGAEKQSIEPEIVIKEEKDINDIAQSIEDFQLRRIANITHACTKVADITTNQEKARELWGKEKKIKEKEKQLKIRHERTMLQQELVRLSNPLKIFTDSQKVYYSDILRELKDQDREGELLQFWDTYRELEQRIKTLKEEDVMFFRLKHLFEEYNQVLLNSISDLMGSFINRSKNRGLSEEELEEVISIGVSVALRTYDPRKGASFSTHAYWRIRSEISQAMNQRLTEVGITSTNFKAYNKYIRICYEMFQILGRMPTPEEVVTQYPKQFTLEDAKDFYRAISLRESASLEAPRTEESDLSLKDNIEDENNEIEFIGDIEPYLNILTDQERKVLEIYYGLTGHPPIPNLAAIGKLPEIKLSRERVRQLYASAIGRILQAIQENPEDFLL